MAGDLHQRVVDLFCQINGRHRMTAADDSYVDRVFTPLATLCRAHGVRLEQARADILARLIPLPSYLRSDNTEMVPTRYLAVVEAAGGPTSLQAWFRRCWPDAGTAEAEWTDFVNGHYLCLRNPMPEDMRRKTELVERIKEFAGSPQPNSEEWLRQLHLAVDELDRIEQPFTDYDRLRFDGPAAD